MNNPYLYIPDEFKDKSVLVTGGTKGAGEAIVRRFGLAGASVATAARSPLGEGQKPASIPSVANSKAASLRSFVQNDYCRLSPLFANFRFASGNAPVPVAR
jgi:NAD(P)-dependent dehydrogenase (short-subunit alcohol dehydrogenase family)